MSRHRNMKVAWASAPAPLPPNG